MKKSNKITAIIMASLLVAAMGIAVVWAADPGTDGDPIVTLSYINSKVIPELKAYVDNAISGITGGSNSADSGPTGFKVVSVEKGKTFWAKDGCEFILRMGTAGIFASAKGGIADATVGTDLVSGSVPANHLLICPVDDGRGFKANTDVLVMVRGAYAVS